MHLHGVLGGVLWDSDYYLRLSSAKIYCALALAQLISTCCLLRAADFADHSGSVFMTKYALCRFAHTHDRQDNTFGEYRCGHCYWE